MNQNTCPKEGLGVNAILVALNKADKIDVPTAPTRILWVGGLPVGCVKLRSIYIPCQWKESEERWCQRKRRNR